jgi:crossover junction endodeoxyribonuclease RuvC
VITFGIDPGSRRTGWGAIRAEGSRLLLLGCGLIEADEESPLPSRLGIVARGLREALLEQRPDAIYIESMFHHQNAKTAFVLAHARGVALLVAGEQGCPVRELSPAEVKKAVTGSGRAEKGQVQEMVKVLLGMERRAQADTADALAVAIAGAAAHRWLEATERAQKGRGGAR